MDNTIYEQIDNVYRKLYNTALRVESDFNSGGFDCFWGFFNNSDSVFRYYPIPVITVCGVGSMALDISSWRFTVIFSKEKILNIPFEKLAERHRFSIACADDDSSETVALSDEKGIYEKLITSISDRFTVTVYMPPDCEFNTIREVIAEFSADSRYE